MIGEMVVPGIVFLSLSAAAHAQQRPGDLAVFVEDDAVLPVEVGVKTLRDLEMMLAQGPLTVLDDRTIDWRLEGDQVPVCLQDDACWRSTATRLYLARLLVVEVYAADDREMARVRVIEPAMEGLPAPVFEVELPRGGGFPVELAQELAHRPLYEPSPPEEERRGLFSRLFNR